MIDFQPSEEQELIIDTVRQFAQNEIRPLARPSDEAGALEPRVLEQAHELGLVANSLPAAFGGGGEHSAVTNVLIAEELAWGDLAYAVAILSPALLGLPVALFGTAEQQSAVLPRLTGAEMTPGAMALVEPRFDFDPFAPVLRAKEDAGDYVLQGTKCFVPWLPGGDTVLVVGATDAGLRGFLVPRDAPGLTATPEQNMGLHALPTVELALADVRVPRAHALGDDAAIRALVLRGRVAQAALATGVARASFELARDYAKERETFGVPIAMQQSIAFKIADMLTEIDGARLLTWEAAWRLDQGEDVTREAALAHQKAARVVLDVADGAVQVYGGHGYTREYLPEMHLRNGRGFASFEALALV